MCTCLGLAFTSPVAVDAAVDDRKFRTHVYESRHLLQDFLTPPVDGQDVRKTVVMVLSVQDLPTVMPMGADSILIFDDPVALRSVKGLEVIDCDVSQDRPWEQIKFTPQVLNELLTEGNKTSISVDFDALADAYGKLVKQATLRELASSAIEHIDPKKHKFVHNAICSYAAGLLSQKQWSTKVVKLLADILTEHNEVSYELNHYVSEDPKGESVWRAFYDHVEHDVPQSEACDRYDAELDDLKYLVEHLGTEKGRKYIRNPKDKPISKRRRKKTNK